MTLPPTGIPEGALRAPAAQLRLPSPFSVILECICSRRPPRASAKANRLCNTTANSGEQRLIFKQPGLIPAAGAAGRATQALCGATQLPVFERRSGHC